MAGHIVCNIAVRGVSQRQCTIIDIVCHVMHIPCAQMQRSEAENMQSKDLARGQQRILYRDSTTDRGTHDDLGPNLAYSRP